MGAPDRKSSNDVNGDTSTILPFKWGAKGSTYKKASVPLALQMVSDGVIAVGLLFILTILRHNDFDNHYRLLAVMTLLLMGIFYNNLGVYGKQTNTYIVFKSLLKAWISVIVCLVFISFTVKVSEEFSRQVILAWIPLTFVMQFAVHIILPTMFYEYKGEAGKDENAIVLGTGRLSNYLAHNINENPWLNVKVIGVVDDSETSGEEWDFPGVPFLGRVVDLSKIIDENNIKSVFISKPIEYTEKISGLYLSLLNKNVDIFWAPDIFGMTLINPSVKEIGGIPVLALSETPLIGSQAYIKSLFDKIMASIALIIASPVMLITAIAIKVTSPGPVIFKQKRHGWNDQVFDIWKFRSMYYVKEKEGEVNQATKDDARVTWVGRIIRRTSIDELPQFFNVLSGSMSMVGPRPHPVDYNFHFAKLINAYFARHRIKPGITGLAQVNGFRGETDTVDKMEKRVEYDIEYINNWSIWLDIKILVKTIFVLFSKNAY